MSDYPNYATADDLCRKEKELQTITFVKVIMMLLVVLGHVTAVYTGAGWGGITPLNDNRILALLSNWVGTFHTQTFTFASGYLFYMLRYEKGRYRNPGKDITRRVKQLCIPYITAALLWVIPSHWLVFGFKNDELIPFLLLGKAPGQLWFLIMLFGVFLIFYCFSVNILVREYRCSGGTDTANPAAGNRCSGTGIPHLIDCYLRVYSLKAGSNPYTSRMDL